jgi:hypothetical protein
MSLCYLTNNLTEAANGLVADLYQRGGQIETLLIGCDSKAPVRLIVGSQRTAAESLSPLRVPVSIGALSPPCRLNPAPPASR